MSFFSWKLRKIMQYLFLITKTLRVVAQIPGLKGSSNVTFPRQPFLPNTRKKNGCKIRCGEGRKRKGLHPGSHAGFSIEGSVTREVSLLELLIYSLTLRPRAGDSVGTVVLCRRGSRFHLDVNFLCRVFVPLLHNHSWLSFPDTKRHCCFPPLLSPFSPLIFVHAFYS